MKTKCLEIRDECTCIPALAIRMEATNPVEHKYLWRSGYSPTMFEVGLLKLSTHEYECDPYHWEGARTMKAAHLWIRAHWDELKDGDVVDVRMTSLGLADKAAEPEIWTGHDVAGAVLAVRDDELERFNAIRAEYLKCPPEESMEGSKLVLELYRSLAAVVS